jgi:hypothetical protein
MKLNPKDWKLWLVIVVVLALVAWALGVIPGVPALI